MDHLNGRIIVSVIILMAAGAYRVLVVKQKGVQGKVTLTRILVGGYILAIVASIIDLIGGPASTVAGLLMALAVMTALYAVIPDLFQRIGFWRTQQPATPGASGRTVK